MSEENHTFYGREPHQTDGQTFIDDIARFSHQSAAGGILLIIGAIAALVWSNCWHHNYQHFWHTEIGLHFGHGELTKSLQHWINDALMVIFFFVVGLEIKREVIAGELATMRKAALPIAAAIGGMVVPAGFYALVNLGGDGMRGWAIPMATDIAFSLGILSLFGRRVPLALKVFLAALAIVDDIGGILVIAFAYTGDVNWTYLAVAMGCFAIMIVMNLRGVWSTIPYLIVGIGGVWFCFLQSGIHATLAGILAAMTIPAKGNIERAHFIERSKELLEQFGSGDSELSLLEDERSRALATKLEKYSRRINPPVTRLEAAMAGWVNCAILPIFALANCGVALTGDSAGGIMSPVSMGIILGLVLGKPVGILLATYLAIKTGIADKPAGVSWQQLAAVSCLAGIGFTMALFLTALAFEEGTFSEQGKVAILIGSAVAGIIGCLLLRPTLPAKVREPQG
ncbi:MAG TPA: Na+/H+ antiporter NhaA [Lentisphaeria bacterium]|nr:Na+/H+ antiporter NhaA [Lentisphaeria bacterium]